ncbi:nuclear mitotic apparatus protein 1-like isoform X1 [Amphibalanus amphitrite]|uniref:nuclear mitotic apparatus protein 1-like isoform X1 n=1 Tax=Amphibalanus amphitrite TaxID=1232801 RepID=UPI001C92183C|nr:nuclear mitotic apparatus protein 1-like isoform X1 [Amphibalanus amphitrite]XP_043189669.1 nuclear mitotic apparatus protein 1-like isoform X1 [Amphibalanus amphitrite]
MSARVGWLVQELEEENSALQLELKSTQDERDQLQQEVEEQRRLLQSCVEEVFSLKEELSQLMGSLGPPAAAERQQQLCQRLARHVSEIEREVAEKGARADEWRAERERRESALAELQQQLELQRQEGCRLSAELQLAHSAADKQAAENQSKIAELEETIDCITKQKATVEENHANEVEALKKSIKDAEESVRTACSGQQQLLAARREQDRLSRQLASVRTRLAERDSRLAENTRQLAERTSQLADAVRSVEVKAAQVVGLKSALHDSKSRTTQLQKELTEKSKQVETQAASIARKDEVIKRQKVKLESVARDLNKLKSVFSDTDLPGICECNEAAIGGSLRDLRALRGGRPLPACPAKQLRSNIAQLKKQLETAQARVAELETSLDDIRQKLPQMSAEADRAYMELQTKLQEQQAATAAAETQQREQQRRNQQLVLKLAAETRRLKDSEQLAQRLRLENRSLVTDRVQWERTSTKLQAALHETVQLTARLQAARAELEAERRLTGQMRQRLDQADAHMKSQLKAVMEELHQLRRSADTLPAPQVDWPRKYEELLDRCQEWQEECLARQKDCITMEQRLGMLAKQDKAPQEKLPEPAALSGGGGAPAADAAQLARLERQLQTLLAAVTRVATAPPGQPARARSVPEIPVPSPRGSERRWSGPADTSSGTIGTADGFSRGVELRPLTPIRDTSQSSLDADGCFRSSFVAEERGGQGAPLSAGQTALVTARSDGTSGSVVVPELAPLLQRVTEIISEVERQRDQLATQGHLLEEYRGRAEGHRTVERRTAAATQQTSSRSDPARAEGTEEEEEEPCRDGEQSRVSRRTAEAGGDDGRPQRANAAQDAQTQSSGSAGAGGGGSLPLPAPPGQPLPPRRHRSNSRRRDNERQERLAHFRALQQLLDKMTVTSDSGTPVSRPLTEPDIPDLSELRAQWRHLETMVRDETESARTRSDVVLRLSGISEPSQ